MPSIPAFLSRSLSRFPGALAALLALACSTPSSSSHAAGEALASIPAASVGASDYQAIGDPRVDVERFASALAGLGITFTRVWLIDAWATATGEPGTYEGVLPVSRAPDGRWDLTSWNPRYFTRVRTFAEAMNRNRIVPVFTVLELYSWSRSKAGLEWVPDQSRGLFRANVNQVRWGDPDAPTFAMLPDAWLQDFSCRVVTALSGTQFVLELGNEMPDKALHDRLAAHLRTSCEYRGELLVNRETTSPDTYGDMRIGTDFDRISFHGMRNVSYLDEKRGGPVATFRDLYGSGIDLSRIILSSDGARKTTNVEDAYDYANLKAVAVDILGRGGSYEHQLAIKLRRFRDGRYDLADLRYDEAFLRDLVAARQHVLLRQDHALAGEAGSVQ